MKINDLAIQSNIIENDTPAKMFSRTYGSPIINYLNHNAFHVKCLAAKATAQKV